MSFIQSIIKNPSRALDQAPKGSSTVTTKGRLLAWSSGLAVEAGSSTAAINLIGVCNQDISAADALTVVPFITLFAEDIWLADSTNNSDAGHNGQLMVLGANGGIVNNTGTTSNAGVVQQVGVYGAASDKKILVKFVQRGPTGPTGV